MSWPRGQSANPGGQSHAERRVRVADRNIAQELRTEGGGSNLDAERAACDDERPVDGAAR